MDILTYVCVLKTSDGELVQILSPSNPITLLQIFIFGSNGLFEITTSPLKRKHKQRHFICQRCYLCCTGLGNCYNASFHSFEKQETKNINCEIHIQMSETYFCILQKWRDIRSQKTISWLTIVGSMDGPEHFRK